MFEKVNPAHPDKVADRIAGAIVDIAYSRAEDPHIAVEALIGHGRATIVAESSVMIEEDEVHDIVRRIAGSNITVDFKLYAQDEHLASNQHGAIRCGDNGIFRGSPITQEQSALTQIARHIYEDYQTDGKYIMDDNRLIICQSNANSHDLRCAYRTTEVNPIGDWSGGTDVDTGAVNRKLGSDMGDGVTGGGLHGKDLSKADVSVNIYAFLQAQAQRRPVELSCAIGDDTIDGIPYATIVETARKYIESVGGFEKFAEWGLIR